MYDTELERKAIRTVRRKKVQDLLAVLFFLLLLPYTCSALTGAGERTAVETLAPAEEERCILWERGNGVWRIPESEFLTGALAASIPGEYEEETLKAQAVILRSICRQREEALESDGLEKGALAEAGIDYLDEESRKQLWGDLFSTYEEKFQSAVEATAGIVVCYGGEAVSPPYFRVSAGQTRDSAQIWGTDRLAWCSVVECPYDLESAEYLQTVRVKREEFTKKMAQEGIRIADRGARVILTRDDAGYVLFVECDGQRMEGERFRKLFGLASACFTIQEEGKEVILTTRGVGHGVGFDQYAADLLACGGEDYQQLLGTFFQGLTLEKVE